MALVFVEVHIQFCVMGVHVSVCVWGITLFLPKEVS
jgi:hypothetical protein